MTFRAAVTLHDPELSLALLTGMFVKLPSQLLVGPTAIPERLTRPTAH
jgi:hypothetical protein